MIATLLSVWLLAQVAAAPGQQSGSRVGGIVVVGRLSRPDPLELTLASPVLTPDGGVLGSWVPLGRASAPWFVYSVGDLCHSAMTQGAMPDDAGDGWRVTASEQSRTASRVTVSIRWERLWERGSRVANPSVGSSELTVKSGDRIPLDRLTRAADPKTCPATEKGLELQVGRASSFSTPIFSIRAGEPTPEALLADRVDAELWLVHRAPDGAETVRHQTLRLSPGGVGFLFRGDPVETADGPMLIDVGGRLQSTTKADGTRSLSAGLTRIVTQQVTGLTRATGSTMLSADWPAPDDVIAFDLPDPYVVTGGGMAGGRGGRGSGGGAVRGGVVSRGGGTVAGGRGGATGGAAVTARALPPNLLVGHSYSLRVRLIESRQMPE